MTTRAILVTGANRGIGRAIVQAILEKSDDTFVYLGARDLNRGAAAITELKELNSAWVDRISVLELDVSSDSSVDSAANIVRQNPIQGNPIIRHRQQCRNGLSRLTTRRDLGRSMSTGFVESSRP